MDAIGTRWSAPDDGAGITAEFGRVSPHERRAHRVPLSFGAGLRQRGASGVSVTVMDLSTDGFRVSTHLALDAGTHVWLRLPSLEPIHAVVKWSRGHEVGCAFDQPLHPAVLDMLVHKLAGR